MIVRLLGPSGAGKSWIVHEILRAARWLPIFVPGRRRPLYYQLGPRRVLGHYEIANGGADTLGSLDEIYGLIRRLHDSSAAVVLYEGKGLSDGAKRTIALHEDGLPVTVIYLTAPTDVCVASVRERGHGIAEESIARSGLRMMSCAATMAARGVTVEPHGRASALRRATELMKMTEVADV